MKLGNVPLNPDEVREWQEAADQGRESWRTDPVEVAGVEGRALGFSADDAFTLVDWFANPNSGTWHATVRAVREDETYDIHLLQPGAIGEGGIWIINDVSLAEAQPPLTGPVEKIRAYFADANPRDIPSAVKQFNDIAPTALGLPEGSFKTALMAETPTETHMRLVLAACSPIPARTEGHLLLWWAGQGLWYQTLDLQPNSAVTKARLVVTSGGAELGLVHDVAFGGSAPYLHYQLMRLDGNEWKALWASPGSPQWRGIHGQVSFSGRGLEEMRVHYSSWNADDAKAHLFHESNPGPHRYFDAIWTRHGEGYERTSEVVTPSAYATLVDFVYALSTGDEAAASSLVADSNLVARGQQLGLAQQPIGQRWLIDLNSPEVERDGPITIVHGPAVRVSFVKSGEAVLISAVEPVVRP